MTSAPNTPNRQGRLNRLINIVSKPFSKPLAWLWGRGFRFLIIIDASLLVLAMALINYCRFGSEWPTYPLRHYWVGFTIAAAIQALVNYFSGLYEREPDIGSRPWLPRVSLAMAIGIAIDGFAALVTDRYLMPRLNLFFLLIVGSLTLTGARYLSRLMARQRRGPARLILVGPANERARVREIIENEQPSSEVVFESQSLDDLEDQASLHDVTDILILDIDTMARTDSGQFIRMSEAGIGLHQRISSLETMLGLRAVRQISGIPFTRLHTQALSSHQSRLKRILDLAIILLASPFLILALLATATYVRCFAGKGVLYRQQRVGYLEQNFQILKFRTMIKNAEGTSGPKLSYENDPRVLSPLKWVRASRLDELPQIWNVLRGEMSLVGPRPERPELVEEIAREVPGYERRHRIKPGVTGMAQVYGRYNSSPAHKLGYDLQYLANWSVMLDIQIMLSTFFTVLRPTIERMKKSNRNTVED